jgi:probable LLM family oxidoreductase
MTKPIEFGLDTFGDVTRGADGALISHAQVIRNVIEEGVLADQLGIDFIGLGEHHRADFAISAPEVTLAAIASRTKNIKLGSAVTVLSSDDPIRVFQRFSTVDAVSNGRAEVILGRGSFTESFPLFGFDLNQYEELFEEKLDLFASLLKQEPVTWRGKLRAPLRNQSVYPPVQLGTLKTWIGVGGSPESVVRAAHYDLPLMLAIIGGDPKRFKPYVDLHHRAYEQFGRPAKPIGVHSPGYVAETDEKAREELWPDYKIMRDRIGKERGWPPMNRAEFVREADHGSLYVGSPETVARKIARAVALPAEIFGRSPAA